MHLPDRSTTRQNQGVACLARCEILKFTGDHESRLRQGCDDDDSVRRDSPYDLQTLCDKDAIKALKDPKRCAMYLAKLLVQCIPEVAVEAGRIMEWLRKVAGIIAKAKRGMMWTTPVGFVVLHENRKPKEVRLATADRMILVYQYDEKQKIDVRKQVDGIVAHLVHWMDAAHMMRTILRLHAEGLRHFAMVHDSYSVHACDVDLLHRVLREEFVRIYSEPVLQNFLEQQRKAHPGLKLPDPPKAGDLDIRQVLESPYFFA
jgi:DNA-directed RNA polymerase, mitochondrial